MTYGLFRRAAREGSRCTIYMRPDIVSKAYTDQASNNRFPMLVKIQCVGRGDFKPQKPYRSVCSTGCDDREPPAFDQGLEYIEGSRTVEIL